MTAEQTNQFTCKNCGAGSGGTPLCGSCFKAWRDSHEPTPTPAPPPKSLPGVPAVETRLLRIQPGDVIIVRHPNRLSETSMRSIRETIRSVFPENQCLVLADGLSIDIIREFKEDTPS